MQMGQTGDRPLYPSATAALFTVAPAPPLGACGLAQNGRLQALPLPGEELQQQRNCFVMSPPPRQIYPSTYRLSHSSAGTPIHQSLKCQGPLENSSSSPAAPVANKEETQQDRRGGGREEMVDRREQEKGKRASPEGMGVTNDTSRCADEEWGDEERQDGRETFTLEET
ncbi:unnamed protein product [Pleuronectes platessa]|uniref:Uncharacterized protein n=1 Tax=Pleuronectes platessa TaxID=8262 RepID=A0A9N7Z4K1_PLEPL|nr:unnamed protein product [Pleuronectes platessa]